MYFFKLILQNKDMEDTRLKWYQLISLPSLLWRNKYNLALLYQEVKERAYKEKKRTDE